jgi:hypothetical protein
LFYDRAYSTALQQSGFEISDPNKDKIQRGLAKARNSLRQVRADFQAKQAIRTAAVEQARGQLINNVRQTNRTVERERQNILKQYQNAKSAGQLARQRATQTVQSTRARIDEVATKITGQVTANLGAVVSAANTTNNFFTSYGSLVGGLNNDAIKIELTRNLVQEAQTINQITQQVQQTPPQISSLSTIKQNEVFINEQTKTITTVSRRLRPSDASNEVELLNRQRAQQLGYVGPLSVDGTQPIPKRLNGQTFFEAKLTITYESQVTIPTAS